MPTDLKDRFNQVMSTLNKPKKTTTKQGLIVHKGISLFSGVMPYAIELEDGTVEIVSVLASPEHLYDKNSLDSLMGVGIYKGHPETDGDNSLDNALGVVLGVAHNFDFYSNYSYEDVAREEKIRGEIEYADITLGFWDDSAIKEGYSEISAGYVCDLIQEDGMYFGSPYQYKKTNIRYNHLAILNDGARNGKLSKIYTDKKDSVENADIKSENTNTRVTVKDATLNLGSTKVLIDSNQSATEITKSEGKNMDIEEIRKIVQSSVNSAFEEKISPLKAEIKSLKDSVDAVVTEVETETATTPSAEQPQPEVNTITPEDLDKEVKERIAIIFKASQLGVEVEEDTLDYEDVMKKTLIKHGYDEETLKNATLENIKFAFKSLKVEKPKKPNATTDSRKTVSKGAAQSTFLSNLVTNNTGASSVNAVAAQDRKTFSEAMALKRKNRKAAKK